MSMITEIIQGLQALRPFILPQYFYDEMGSKLFEAITLLDEYYPTRTEQKIMAHSMDAIATVVNGCDVLIDLGAGNCQKASQLFSKIKPKQYLALDISKDFLEAAIADLQKIYPEIEMQAQVVDLHQPLRFPGLELKKKIFFYPGSSIGNFTPNQALQLLNNLAEEGHDQGGVLIGVDLVKDHETLELAYNDALGVTAAFNLNTLQHVNRIIGSDFQVNQWRHHAIFNADQSRIEMYLQAKSDQTVTWPNGQCTFLEGALIHTENSYKYTQEGFVDLLQQAGFKKVHTWTDAQHYFLVCYAELHTPNVI